MLSLQHEAKGRGQLDGLTELVLCVDIQVRNHRSSYLQSHDCTRK